MASASNPEFDVWIKNIGFTTDAIAGEGQATVVGVAGHLYSAGLINQVTKDAAITPSGLPPNHVVSQLLLPVGNKIKNGVPGAHSGFLSVLKKFGLSFIADKLTVDNKGTSASLHSSQTELERGCLVDHIAEYQQYLKRVYSADEYPLYLKPQFAVHRPKHIVNLVMVHRKKDEVDDLQKQCLLYQLHGNVDMIQQKKTRVTIEDIGKPHDDKVPHFILIEGAPGIGKTTFCWQLCRLWAEGKLMEMWDMVVLVQLRDELARNAKNLPDLLYHSDRELKETVCRSIEKQEGKRVLLLFDGYDELSDAQLGEISFLQQLLRNPRLLREATIMITSRPFATKSLPFQFKQSLERHIEIVGFDEDDIETYLSSACEDKQPALLDDLHLYVSSRPFISSVMYNPLHCSIVTELYIQYWQKGEKGFAPNSLTDLYDALLLNLMRRTLETDVEELCDLPPEKYTVLMELAALAARGVETKVYIFDDVPHDTLSLMHSVKSLYNIRARRLTSYTFLHLTLQEYLASLHWSRLSSKELGELVQRQDLFPIQQYLQGTYLKEDDKPTRMTHWPVLIFIAGLTKLAFLPLKQIMEWIGLPDDESDRVKLHPSLCQLLFETQSPALVASVFRGMEVEPVSIDLKSPLDWFVTGYCVSVSETNTLWTISFGMSRTHKDMLIQNNRHTPHSLLMLSSGLRFMAVEAQDARALHSLSISTGVMAPDSKSLETFTSLYPYSQAIKSLWLNGDLDSSDAGTAVLLRLSHYCPKLVTLKLPRINSPCLSTAPQLPHDTLTYLELTLPIMEDDSSFVPELQRCKVLKQIGLNVVSKETSILFFLICLGPLLTKQITKLELNNLFISSDYADVIATTQAAARYRLVLYKCELTNSNYAYLTTGSYQPHVVNGDNIRHVTVEITPQ